MITAKELRIGNHLEYFIDGEFTGWVTMAIDSADIVWAENNNDGFNKAHRPIPITPEILEAAGFVKVYASKFHQTFEHKDYEDFSFQIWSDVSTVPNLKSIKFHGFRIKCEYVHQLQNIIHSTTGEELQITLP